MSESNDFLAAVMPRQKQAETAMHNGDAGPRLDFWSPNDPVTLFGALQTRVGWEDVSATFRWVASRFSDCSSYEIELIAGGASKSATHLCANCHCYCRPSHLLPQSV